MLELPLEFRPFVCCLSSLQYLSLLCTEYSIASRHTVGPCFAVAFTADSGWHWLDEAPRIASYLFDPAFPSVAEAKPPNEAPASFLLSQIPLTGDQT